MMRACFSRGRRHGSVTMKLRTREEISAACQEQSGDGHDDVALALRVERARANQPPRALKAPRQPTQPFAGRNLAPSRLSRSSRTCPASSRLRSPTAHSCSYCIYRPISSPQRISNMPCHIDEMHLPDLTRNIKPRPRHGPCTTGLATNKTQTSAHGFSVVRRLRARAREMCLVRMKLQQSYCTLARRVHALY